jgi:heavy metal sensor kinase
MRVRSLRIKLGITSALLIATVFSCFGLLRYGVVRFQVLRSFDRRLREDAQFLALHVKLETTGRFSLVREPLGPAESAALERIRSSFIVTDSQGIVIESETYSRQIAGLLISKVLDDVLRQHDGIKSVESPEGWGYRFASLPLPSKDGTPELFLHVAMPTEQLHSVLRESLSVYTYFLPLVLVLSGIVGWFLADRAIRPFGQLAQSASRISALNLNQQVVSPYEEEEVQRLVTAFNEMVSRLGRSFQQLRQFNADVAHELRTPLAVLRGETELALSSPTADEDLRAVLSSNMEELDRLENLVNQMLTLSEAESGMQVLAKKPFNLKPVIDDLVEQIRPLAAVRGIRIEAEQLSIAVLNGDELWVRRAVVNVLDNAIKYSKDDGTVEVRCRVENGLVRVGIADHGIGIPPGDLPHVFDRLYRADPARSRSSGGLGLGLSIVKWVVEAHDGRVRLSSDPESGTLCEIEFPLAPVLPLEH